MTVSHAAATKIFLGIVLSIFCGVLMLYALGLGNLTKSEISNIAQWSAIVILFMITLVLPNARRRDAIRNPDKNLSAPGTVANDNGKKSIRTGIVLLILSVVLFFCSVFIEMNFLTSLADAVDFAGASSLFFGAIYLVAGLRQATFRAVSRKN